MGRKHQVAAQLGLLYHQLNQKPEPGAPPPKGELRAGPGFFDWELTAAPAFPTRGNCPGGKE